jgi:hypothetical protein
LNPDAEIVHLLGGLLAHALLVELPQDGAEHAGLSQLPAEKHVLGDIELGRDGELLVDRFDAGQARFDGRREPDRRAVEIDPAGIRNQRARQHLDQGRLAGAIVADHGEDLAAGEFEIGAFQGDDLPVMLGEADRLHREAGIGGEERRHARCPRPRY